MFASARQKRAVQSAREYRTIVYDLGYWLKGLGLTVRPRMLHVAASSLARYGEEEGARRSPYRARRLLSMKRRLRADLMGVIVLQKLNGAAPVKG